MSRDIAGHIRAVGFARFMCLATAVFPRDAFGPGTGRLNSSTSFM